MQLAAGHPAARRGDHLVGQRHHLRSGTVVALQADHGRVGEAAGEVEQVARRGAGERVDGLVGVADDGEVVAVTEPGVEHPLLQRGDVLVLVDHEAAVAVAELLGHGRVVLDRGRGVQQQVVEVQQRDAVAVGLELLVAGVDGGHLLGVQRDVAAHLGHRGAIALRADQRRLGPFDLAREVADVLGADLKPGAVGGLGDDGELGVQQLPAGVADHPRPEVVQLPARGGVEGQRLHRADAGACIHRAQPGPHLPRGPRGERDGQHLPGGDVAVGHQVRDAVGDGAGLAGARAGQHAHRPARGQHGFALFVVQAGQLVHDRRHGVHLVRGRRQFPGALR